MKKITNLTSLILILLIGGVFQACKKDEKDEEAKVEPKTNNGEGLAFKQIYDKSFRLWTDHKEINTDGIDPKDYMTPSDYDKTLEKNFVNALYSFSNGFLYQTDKESGIKDSTNYFISNDSIYASITFPGDFEGGDTTLVILFGIGNTSNFHIPLCIFRFNQSSFTISGNYPGNYTIENLGELLGTDPITKEDFDEGDSLYIYNMKVRYN